MSKELCFRSANRGDTALILQFIKELADYEKMADEVVANEELLEEWIFDKQKAEVIFAVADGKEEGFALFFHNFSTFLGRAGIYLGPPRRGTGRKCRGCPAACPDRLGPLPRAPGPNRRC